MRVFEDLQGIDPVAVYGRVAQAVGTVIEGYGPISSIGEVCEIRSGDDHDGIFAEVVGFRANGSSLCRSGTCAGLGRAAD